MSIIFLNGTLDKNEKQHFSLYLIESEDGESEAISIVQVKKESGLEQGGINATDAGLPTFMGFEERGDGVKWHLGKWESKSSRGSPV